MSLYCRELSLRDRLNNFLVHEFKLPAADYYNNLSIESLLSLKGVLADIHNIFTLRVCLDFVDWLAGSFKLNEVDTSLIRESVLKTKPSSNGFDLHVVSPIKAIAEVKCNIPINRGRRYGSQQRDGIEKDVNALLQGKSKAKVNLDDYLKFLVLMGRPEIRDATHHLLSTSMKCKDKLIIISPLVAELDRRDIVYVVFVGT